MLMLALLCNTASVTSLLCQEPKFKHAKECVQLPEAEEPHLVTGLGELRCVSVSELHSSAKIHLKTAFGEHNNKNSNPANFSFPED